MNKDKNKIQKRADFVKQFVNNSNKPTSKAVESCAKRLFLSEKTIWNDLQKD